MKLNYGQNGIEAAEALAWVTITERALRKGDLVVFEDFAGRQIGGSLKDIHEDGTCIVRVIGDQGPYRNGWSIPRDAKHVQRAV